MCYGSEMAAALYDIQDNYPTVNYLMIGDEPHSEDYTDYRTSANVHCVLFREEQAAAFVGAILAVILIARTPMPI